MEKYFGNPTAIGRIGPLPQEVVELPSNTLGSTENGFCQWAYPSSAQTLYGSVDCVPGIVPLPDRDIPICGTEISPNSRKKEKAQSEKLDHHKVYSGGE
jgi:hypothetical protein